MTRDDYEQMRSMYADVDDLCRGVEAAGSTEASDESLRRLVALLQDQQREPAQIRSFVRHLGASDDAVRRLLGNAMPEEGEEGDAGIA